MKLYQLSEEYEQLAQLAENASDEMDQQAFRDTMEGLSGEIGEKVINCAAVVKSLDAEAFAIKCEEERLCARRKAIENSMASLKSYMQRGMEAAKIPKIKGELFTVSIQNNPPAVVLDTEQIEKLPPEYQRVTVAANKTAIGETLKRGEALTFAHLEYTRSIRIR